MEPEAEGRTWCLERVVVTVHTPAPETPVPDTGPAAYTLDNPVLDGIADDRRVWLGDPYGKSIALRVVPAARTEPAGRPGEGRESRHVLTQAAPGRTHDPLERNS